MKVNIIKKQTIEDYAATIRHKCSFEKWKSKVKFADWNSPGDIIAGNNYRMICK